MIMVAIILAVSAAFEMRFIHGEFNDFYVCADTLYEKIEEKTATEDDVYALQKIWITAKSRLHAFISHNEIKEFDMWISETIKLVRNEMWEEALAKAEVIKELAEQIPKTFDVSLANIF